MQLLRRRKDMRWLLYWVTGMLSAWIWNLCFLNSLSYSLLSAAIVNTFFGASLAVVLALVLGWGIGSALHFLEQRGYRPLRGMIIFITNLIRSVPQIIGLLIGYMFLTFFIEHGILPSHVWQIVWMSCVISVVCSLEVIDLIMERIDHYRRSDYVVAMLCCGIKESRIVHGEILWKSSRAHLVHKAVNLFGVAIFLQCSIDFIISVGLSTDVSLSNFPATLGSLLAKLDSKQDILAFGSMFVDPSYIPRILFLHLQGVTIAFIIVYTLVCMFQIADGLVKQYDL